MLSSESSPEVSCALSPALLVMCCEAGRMLLATCMCLQSTESAQSRKRLSRGWLSCQLVRQIGPSQRPSAARLPCEGGHLLPTKPRTLHQAYAVALGFRAPALADQAASETHRACFTNRMKH